MPKVKACWHGDLKLCVDQLNGWPGRLREKLCCWLGLGLGLLGVLPEAGGADAAAVGTAVGVAAGVIAVAATVAAVVRWLQ